MSIIYESLKKIEKEGTTLQHPIPGIEKAGHTKSGLPRRTRNIWLYALLCLAGIIIAAFSFKASPPAPKRQTAPLKENLPPATPQPLEPLTLNGIFFSGESGYALINNQIIKEGDMIAGVMVMKVSEDSVELKSDQGIIKLSTRP